MMSLIEGGCFGWPDVHFSPYNYVNDLCSPSPDCADTGLSLQTGDDALDFKLTTVDGSEIIQLSVLYEEKPVFLEFASYTCNTVQQVIRSPKKDK